MFRVLHFREKRVKGEGILGHSVRFEVNAEGHTSLQRSDLQDRFAFTSLINFLDRYFL